MIRSVSLFQAKQAVANVQNNKTETNPNFEDVKIQETWLLFDDEESLKLKVEKSHIEEKQTELWRSTSSFQFQFQINCHHSYDDDERVVIDW